MWLCWSHKAAHFIMAEIDQPAPIWVISLRIQWNTISRLQYFAFTLLFDPPSHEWVSAALCRYEFLLTAPVFAQPISSWPLNTVPPILLKRITDHWREAKPLYLLRCNVALTIYTGVSTSESLCLSLNTVCWDWQPQQWALPQGLPDLFGSWFWL